MTAGELWNQYWNNYPTNAWYTAWSFCGGGQAGDRLARLVLDGTKTATASQLELYLLEGEPVPQVGDYSVILLDSGEAVCIIRDTKVTKVPFSEVTEQHAYLEGEGSRTLEEWRKVHREVFTQECEEAGKTFSEQSICVLEEFEVVYRA